MHTQFNQENNRLEYGALLYPSSGMSLSYAVGMTYSLDLEALLSVPVAFGVLESQDEEMMKNPIVVLEAIRKCSDKLTLFCNIDGIKLPREIRLVYSLLENSIVPVNLGKGVNFHPKMWVIRYEGNKKEIIKVIILSRNLTYDRSMDVAVEVTGEIDRERKRLQKKHQPIADLLNYMADYVSDDKKSEIRKLADDVLHVGKFDIVDKDNRYGDYDDYNFLPVGFLGYEKKAEGFFNDASSILIVSPFLSKSVLGKITKNAKNRVLISRYSSITTDIFHMFDEVYVPIDGIENDNPLEEGEPDNATKRDLHAKVVYKESKSGNYLYIGSLNTTANAFYKNIEIMFELKFKPRIASLKRVKEDFVIDKNRAFQQMLCEPRLSKSEESEEMVDFSDIAEAIKHARVIDCNGTFCTELQGNTYNSNAEVKPLFGKTEYKKLDKITRFEHMTMKELSEFYAIRKKDQVRVLKICTDGIPISDRDRAIFNSIIDSKPMFLQYILFLLADDPVTAVSENEYFMKILTKDGSQKSKSISPAIYEEMLLTAARDPKRLEAVKEILNKIDKKVLDNDLFESMLNVFMKAVEGR